MGPGLLATLNRGADRTSQWAAVALGFSIPISTALDNVLVAIVLAAWLASGAWQMKWNTVRGNRVALAALALFGLLLLGMLYGERNPGDSVQTLRKYLDLLWIPVLLWVFRDAPTREKAVHALAISIAAVLLLSFLVMANLIPEFRENFAYTLSATVFRTRQTHGALMALGAFTYAQLAFASASPRMRVLWLTLAILALFNGTLVVQGATGYLIFGALALYLGFTRMGWRGMAGTAVIAGGLAAALVLTPGQFQGRVSTIVSEARQWQPGVMDLGSSVGTRLELYRVTAEVIQDRPVLGHGTGSFAKSFADKTRSQALAQQRNPHSEYLHMLVQLGLLGLAGLLFLFVTHWRLSPDLATPLESHLARALLLTMAVGCLFNSWLLDHTEGLLFAWLTGVLFAGLGSRGSGFPNPR